jgi:hypothetical protein
MVVIYIDVSVNLNRVGTEKARQDDNGNADSDDKSSKRFHGHTSMQEKDGGYLKRKHL